jgi:hypothetical protein
MRSSNFTTIRWLQVALILWTAASSSVSVSAVRTSEFSFAGMLTIDGASNDSNADGSINTDANNKTDASSYAVPAATAELLTDLFLPAVTFDAVTFDIVAVTDSNSTTDNNDNDKNKYIAVGQAAAVAHNNQTLTVTGIPLTSPLRLWAVIQDTAQEDWPDVNLNITQRKALIVSIRDHVVRHELQGVHLECAACMRTDAKDNHRVNKLRFLNEIIDSLHEVHKLVSVQVQVQMGHELPRYLYKNIDRVHLHSSSVEWPEKALLNYVAAMKKDMPCTASTDSTSGCPTDKIHVAISATAVASKKAIASKGASSTLPVADVWRDILRAAYAPNDSGRGRGRGVWNQTAAAQLDKASTWWGDVTLTSPKTVRHKVAWAKRMGLGGVYVWNLQDDLCVPDLAPAGIMLEAAAKTKIFNAEKLLQLLVVDQQHNGDDDDVRDEL